MRMIHRAVTLAAVLVLASSVSIAAEDGIPKPWKTGFVKDQPSEGTIKLRMATLGSLTLYDQIGDGVANSISSQEFEDGFNPFSLNPVPANGAYDTWSADDFTVPADYTWFVDTVTVVARWNEPTTDGPADAVHVVFYQDNSGEPGTVVSSQTITGPFADPNFVLSLTTPVELAPGTYWLSVQAQMDEGTSGYWFWSERGDTDPRGEQFLWQNPDNGWGYDCTSWTDPDICFGGAVAHGHGVQFSLGGEHGDADLSIDKTGPAAVDVDTDPTISYVITITNNGGTRGDYDVTNVTVTDVIDPSLPYNDTLTTCTHGTWGEASGVWTWDIGTLEPIPNPLPVPLPDPLPWQAACTLVVDTTTGVSPGNHTNTADVSADQPDLNAVNDSDDHTVDIANLNVPRDIGVTKVADVDTQIPGGQVVFTITVTNNETVNEAVDVTITDHISSDFEYVSHSCSVANPNPPTSGSWYWYPGNMVAGASESCTLTMNVAADATGTISNTATVTSDSPDSQQSDNTSTDTVVVETSDLSIEKTVSDPGAFKPSDNFDYTITVTNNGPHDATGIVVEDLLDSYLAYNSDDCSIGVAGQQLTWNLGSLANGASTSCTVTVDLDAGTPTVAIDNMTGITALDQVDPNSNNNTANAPKIGVVIGEGQDSYYSFTSSCAATSGPTATWFDITTDSATAMGMEDDDTVKVAVNLFPFPFYGIVYTDVQIGNNGGIILGSVGKVTNPNFGLPDLGYPFIATYWEDLDDVPGDIYYKEYQTCPVTAGGTRQCFIAQWAGLARYPNKGDSEFQAVLYIGGDILLQYRDMSFGYDDIDFGAGATIGIESHSLVGLALEHAFDVPRSIPTDTGDCTVFFEINRDIFEDGFESGDVSSWSANAGYEP